MREAILDATERLLIETGDVERISIRAVAEGVGRTPPSIYLHFDTKDDLIRAVCHRQFGALTAVFEEAIAGVDHPIEQIEAMAGAYVRFAVEHPEQYRILFMSGIQKGDGAPGDLDELALTECFGMLVTAVQAAAERQLIEADDPGLVALALWASTHGVASLLISTDLELPPLDAFVGQVVRQNMRGLLARD